MARGWRPNRGSDDDDPPNPPTRRKRPFRSVVDPAAPIRPEPGGKGTEDDRTISVHLGKRWSQVVGDIRAGDYTWADFVAELDPEELARGQLKDSKGGWRGRPPALVPREFHLACQRELKNRFEEIFSNDVLKIAREYVKLAQDTEIPAKDRAKMMQYAMERIFGGIPREYKVQAEGAWESVFVDVTSDGSEGTPEWRSRRYAGYQERMGIGDGGEESDGEDEG